LAEGEAFFTLEKTTIVVLISVDATVSKHSHENGKLNGRRERDAINQRRQSSFNIAVIVFKNAFVFLNALSIERSLASQ
jgi:hypothetical protein